MVFNQIHANKIQNRFPFKIKTGYYLGLLTPQATKLLGSTKNKATKDEHGKNLTHLKMIEVVLFHCDIVSNDY